MPLEYEYNFHKFNKILIMKKLKEIGAVKKGVFLFKVQVFNLPNNKNGYLRVRDEGYRITMTHKNTGPLNKFQFENETIIDSFDEGINILLNLGCIKKYYYEKIREIWTFMNSEIVFDTMPGLPDIMEIESLTKKELNKVTKMMGLEIEPLQDKIISYKHLYNVDLTKISNIKKFTNIKKLLIPHVKKNKTLFERIVDKQMVLYKKIK